MVSDPSGSDTVAQPYGPVSAQQTVGVTVSDPEV